MKVYPSNQTTQANQKVFELHENEEEESPIEILKYYSKNKIRAFFFLLMSMSTIGFVYLMSLWSLSFKIWILYRKCSFREADFILITLSDKRRFLQNIIRKKLQVTPNNAPQVLRTFEYKRYQYYFDESPKVFRLIRFPLRNYSNTQIHEFVGNGLPSTEKLEFFQPFYGPNSIEISETPIFYLLFNEMTSPYFIFPILSCLIWFLELYQIYATVIFCFTGLSVFMNILSESQNMKKLKAMSYFKIDVNVFRGISANENLENIPNLQVYKKTISSLDLLPGDLIEIPENACMPADIVLLNGICIMNEKMITGENTPVKKNALPFNDRHFHPRDENRTSILYSGTFCIESRSHKKNKFPVLGLVYDTGFNTFKGHLVRSILFPKPVSFNFYIDSLKFIFFMGIISILGLGWTIYAFQESDATTEEMIFASLDLITVVIPPALPTCMSFGIAFTLYRLKKCGINCSQPEKINMAGNVDIMCFDKTGTLTEDGLEIKGILPVHSFDSTVPIFQNLKEVKEVKTCQAKSGLIKKLTINMHSSIFKQTKKTQDAILWEGLACCHSLCSVNDQLIGDPLDIKMFEETGWELEENFEDPEDFLLGVVSPPLSNPTRERKGKTDFKKVRESILSECIESNSKIGIIKRFEFSSRLQRMSVVVRNMDEQKFRIHVKGSPEKLRELCKPETVPKNFHETLDKYSRDGFRVLAFGSRTLKMSTAMVRNLERDDVEKNLVFLGFMIIENKIKSVTSNVIHTLQEANIRTIMITGDNILTAISVAKQCNLIAANHRVYYAEVPVVKSPPSKRSKFSTKEKPAAGGDLEITWKDFDCSDNTLHPLSLNQEKRTRIGEGEIVESESNENYFGNEGNNFPNFNNSGKDVLLDSNHLNKLRSMPTYEEIKLLKLPSPKKFPKDMLGSGQLDSIHSVEYKPDEILTHSTNIKKSHFQKKSIASPQNFPLSSPNNFLLKSSQIYKFIMRNSCVFQAQSAPWAHMKDDNYSLAISGKVYSVLLQMRKQNPSHEKIFDKMLEKTHIFARMRPREKASVIGELKKKYPSSLIGMCGDGANDCAALSAADIGIALSQTEAASAAPFTSLIQDISCVEKLFKKGKCALVTSLQCFKYMIMYSMIQFITVGTLYSSFANLSNTQFLWIDLVIILPITLFMGYTKAADKLTKHRPTSNLMSFPIIVSMIGQILIQFAFQLLTYLLTIQHFPACNEIIQGDNIDAYSYCHETSNVFTVANFEYLSTVLAFSIGPPFRKPVYQNFPIAFSYLVIFLCCFYLFAYPNSYIQDVVPILSLSFEWKVYLTIIILGNFFLTFIYEKIMVNFLFFLWKSRKNPDDPVLKDTI